MSFWDFIFGKVKIGGGALTPSDRELIRSEWAEIETLLKLGDPSGRKEALIRADKALDVALKRLSSGETMGERLKNSQKLFLDYVVYDELWQAHKMRNALVHEAGFEPTYHSFEKAVRQIKAGLKDLGVDIG